MTSTDRAINQANNPDQDIAKGAMDLTPRELRAQAIQRLQVGLFGLSLMLLLVGLANIIMDHARANDAAMAASSKAAVSSGGAGGTGPVNTDPLADIGMAPVADGAAKPKPAHTPTH